MTNMLGPSENKMLDPANTPLGRMLVEEITPVVMVLRTPLVEEACLKNGLSFVQMLSPYCVFNNIDVPVRTASDQPYRLQKFKLRLFYASDVRQPNLEDAKDRLKHVITHAGEELLDLSLDPPKIENVLTSSQAEILPSWFQFFNKELVRTLSFSDHEAFDHPVACLLVVSSKDEQPINRFVDLFNTNQLPALLNDGVMDPKILKHYLLVHDNQDGSTEKAAKIIAKMRSTFGSNDCQLLCINSSDGPIEHEDNPWFIHKTDALPGQRLGCFLNIDDCNEMKDLLQDLSTRHIIPHMEQKIRLLNQQVSATRKGFRNQLKNLWWRKGKDDVPDAPNGPMYSFSSIESQIRVLGDYAFMLRDYELALSNYRLLSTDYKLDKAWKRYAGVQEMIGLTFFMLDQSRKESEFCMENAFSTYLKIGLSARQNATRCGLWWVEMLKARDQFKEAAGVYFRISGEEPLHSAVMLEQASYCYLFSKPPMLRKYGFHLVLSGDIYKSCDQIKHAIRTYRNALSVYKGTTWSRVKDHVHFHIGQWYAFLGMFDVAVAHMLEVLACSHQSKTTQELFLKDFLQIVQKTGKTFEVSRLQLPIINIPSLKVIFEDHRTYASPAAAAVRQSLWQSLEEDVVPSMPIVKTNWLESQPKLISKQYEKSNVCVAGEAIRLNIEFKNPLQISISIANASLICELTAKSDEVESGVNSSTTELLNDDEFRKSTASRSVCRELNSETSSFILSEANLSLAGGETIVAQLTVIPKIEGILKIVGVRWKLSGYLVGFHDFESSPVKKKLAKGRRKSKHSPRDYLNFIVIKSLPKLEGTIHHLPKKVYMGDLRRLDLELRNQTEFPVKNMKMKISHPRFLSIGNQEILNMDFPSCLEKKAKSEQSHAQAFNEVSQSVFLFPEDVLIQGEAPFLWPIWLRAAVPGNISLYVIIYYEMGDSSNVMKYRTLRMNYNLEVLPSLDVSFQISHCPSKLQEFIVHMDVVNRTSSDSFQVHQLSSVGNQWEMSLLQPVDNIFPSQVLMAGRALSCFFKLKNSKKSEPSEGKGSSLIHLRGSDIRLGLSGSSELLFDISSSPLADFHHYERLHQEVSHKVHPNTVDFILISRLGKTEKGNINLGQPDPLLLSIHACHRSVTSTCPIWWIMDGPRIMDHNFSVPFCEIDLRIIIHNSSDAVASVRINTFDSTNRTSQLDDSSAGQSASPGNQSGWHDLSLVNDIEVTSDVTGSQVANSQPLESVSPFIWSGMSSNKVELDPMSRAEIPLQISVFSPGTYDLSDYVLDWSLLPSDGQENRGTIAKETSGTCPGHPYYLTVLQSISA
ncbi:uncharacterized protein LOC131146026 isoform X2 [Malania oleifera]|uniref:uncharacterized protein LOC131146026 isoform X2 n=1 Tax=Malania oleifera TaxID=397392 RepID=UPI0025ADB497|nr:uncharacterized protein LOC131146026 isoform X2 [Malania oleifera]